MLKVNANNDNGLLVGGWGSVHDGINPNNWNSSVQIFKMFKDSNFQPVKWAQCWVYAAVVVTGLKIFINL